MSVGAVVAAAGRSRRMGREKVLLPLGRSTMLERILRSLAEAGIGGAATAVVVRPDLFESAELARRAGARVVVNPDPDAEMLSSIRLGLAVLPREVHALFVWPADHPLVRASTLRALLPLARKDGATIPLHAGRRGHPVLLGRELAREAEVEQLPGGLRDLWRRRLDAVAELETGDPGVVLNVDTHEDYERAIALLEGGCRQ